MRSLAYSLGEVCGAQIGGIPARLEPRRAQPIPPPRRFLVAIGNLARAGSITMNGPQIAVAAEHAGHASPDASAPPPALTTLSPAEAAEIDAIANQIVPGGATP